MLVWAHGWKQRSLGSGKRNRRTPCQRSERHAAGSVPMPSAPLCPIPFSPFYYYGWPPHGTWAAPTEMNRKQLRWETLQIEGLQHGNMAICWPQSNGWHLFLSVSFPLLGCWTGVHKCPSQPLEDIPVWCLEGGGAVRGAIQMEQYLVVADKLW